MTPEAFVSKWSQTTTKERAAAHEHFIDLCGVLGEKTPHEADPTGDWYAFEKGVQKTGAGKGWADVWKRGCFGWEYKGKGKNLSEALKQLQLYALALESPPLLIVCDLETIEIHTAFQNAVQEVHVLTLQDLLDPAKLQLLKWAFSEPERLRPERTRNAITEHAASQFANLAFQLRDGEHTPHTVAHFLNKLLFCMFAEDAGLLPKDLFVRVLKNGIEAPEHFDTTLRRLFAVMREGGPFGVDMVSWFNGGIFDGDETLPLSLEQVRLVLLLAQMDWSQIEPSIFGTLFERGLDPDKRSQLGAHYTDADSILRLVTPTIVEPLLAEWTQSKKEIVKFLEQIDKVKTRQARQRNHRRAENVFQTFLERLRNFRVLDPACGSGNFLYLSLRALKDLEHRANVEAEALGLERQFPLVGPGTVLGVEINAYAAELARVTVWIGEIQWMLQHGYQPHRDPILRPLETIEQRDAVIDEKGSEPSWPNCDVIIGNPPFLGDRKMIGELGEEYVQSLRSLYSGRVPGGADFVVYWHAKAFKQLLQGKAQRAGLVATNSIRGGANRRVFDQIVENGSIFDAWSDEPWVNEGADVRVSLICFDANGNATGPKLNGKVVTKVLSDLTSTEVGAGREVDLTKAKRLTRNARVAFIGSQKNGAFDIPGEVARRWLFEPNPHGQPNSEVLFPWLNGSAITKRNPDKWIIDFDKMSEVDASLYEIPFEHVLIWVKPSRGGLRRKWHRIHWWLHGDPRPAMKEAIAGLDRYIITPRVAKHRLFVWAHKKVLADSATVAIARDDEETFGILHSRFHELWTLRMCTWLGVGNDPRYTPTSTFDTFPFPDGLTPDLGENEFTNNSSTAIAQAARELDSFRRNWLNPSQWVDWEIEDAEGYPKRLHPREAHVNELKRRTLTNLYNERPAWLSNAHRTLDEAVASAYGWPADLSDDDVVARLFDLNLQRAS